MIWSTIPAFAWRDEKNRDQLQGSAVCVAAKMQIGHFPNTVLL